MEIEDQQRFCARWLDQRGVYGQPTLQQLMEMAEAWAAYRLRLRSGTAIASAASEALAGIAVGKEKGGESFDSPPL